MDITSIAAVFRFDGNTRSAVGDATVTYTVGPTAGNPIFDLRQAISEAWLDGVNLLAHHNFGVGPFTDLRVIQAVESPGSVHTLRLQYPLTMPNSQLGGSYRPVLEWAAGPILQFAFGLSDLNRARYAEAWLPANLIFDQYSINLELQIVNTATTHQIITNGAVVRLGLNHWRVNYPDYSSAVSPLLEVRASDAVTQLTDRVTLPVSGKTVTIEAWKPVSSTVDLQIQIDSIKTLLGRNETDYGRYLHGSRFVAFLRTLATITATAAAGYAA
jgi:hypothetical protein